MLTSKRVWLSVLLLIALVALGWQQREAVAELEADLAAASAALAEQRAIMATERERVAADSLVYLRRLRSVRAALDTLQDRPTRDTIFAIDYVPSVAPEPEPLATLEERRPSQYDSLVFALEKADLEIASLRKRLRRSSATEYLAFESAKGNDVYYVGEVRDGEANGRGTALFSTGSRYAGEWRDNMRHGEGEFYWKDGAYYEGEFAADQRSGRGTYHFPNGQYFVGDWAQDLRNGRGTFYDKDGTVVAQGIWRDDELAEEL